MAAVTRFGLEGYGVRRAGSFAGKNEFIDDSYRDHQALTGTLVRGTELSGEITRSSTLSDRIMG